MKRIWLLLLALALLCSFAAKPAFNGSRIMNADLFEMEYTALNGTISHTLELHDGDVLDVYIEDIAGRLDASVRPEGGAPIYRGADIPDARFQLPISEGGRYEISVTGDGARGSVRFARVRSEAAAPDSQFTDRTKED